MGKLLEAVRSAWTNHKLRRGQCDWCGNVIPDNQPVKDQQACSEDCANDIWASKAI